MEITVSDKAILVDGVQVCWRTQIDKLEWLAALDVRVDVDPEADAFATHADEEEMDYWYRHTDSSQALDLDERSGVAWL